MQPRRPIAESGYGFPFLPTGVAQSILCTLTSIVCAGSVHQRGWVAVKISEFWMPGPFPETGAPDVGQDVYKLLTASEGAILRRLMRGDEPVLPSGRRGAMRQRTVLQRRRHTLAQLSLNDLRSLVQIILELGL